MTTKEERQQERIKRRTIHPSIMTRKEAMELCAGMGAINRKARRKIQQEYDRRVRKGFRHAET